MNRNKLITGIALVLSLVLGVTNVALANPDYVDYFADQNILLYDPLGQDPCIDVGNSQTASLSNVPEPWRGLISKTAPEYTDADPRLVAATLWIENRGWPQFNKDWAVSPAGAQGPWQFIPSTWAIMGHDGDGDGIKDPNNPYDAVHAAFKHQANSAGKPIIEGFIAGDIEGGMDLTFKRDGQNLLSFLANYNGSGAPNNTKLSDFPRGENADYVIMGYYVLATNFTESYDRDKDERIKMTTASSGGAGFGCGTPGQGWVDTDGLAFPIGMPKKSISNGYAWPCETFCHHDGSAAFDLAHVDTVTKGEEYDIDTVGTPVYAIADGVIKSFNHSYDGIEGCHSFQLVTRDGEDDTDYAGFRYWYGHVANSTVAEGEEVKAGQLISQIGQRECTGNGSYPHLHIDRGFPKGQNGGFVDKRDKGFISIMNRLYEGLPE